MPAFHAIESANSLPMSTGTFPSFDFQPIDPVTRKDNHRLWRHSIGSFLSLSLNFTIVALFPPSSRTLPLYFGTAAALCVTAKLRRLNIAHPLRAVILFSMILFFGYHFGMKFIDNTSMVMLYYFVVLWLVAGFFAQIEYTAGPGLTYYLCRFSLLVLVNALLHTTAPSSLQLIGMAAVVFSVLVSALMFSLYCRYNAMSPLLNYVQACFLLDASCGYLSLARYRFGRTVVAAICCVIPIVTIASVFLQSGPAEAPLSRDHAAFSVVILVVAEFIRICALYWMPPKDSTHAFSIFLTKSLPLHSKLTQDLGFLRITLIRRFIWDIALLLVSFRMFWPVRHAALEQLALSGRLSHVLLDTLSWSGLLSVFFLVMQKAVLIMPLGLFFDFTHKSQSIGDK